MADYPRCRRTSWAELDGWADRLAAKIRAADRVPETLVALTRGGWVPARLLADRLDVKQLHAVRARHWGVTATPSGRAELTEGLSQSIRGEKVLVVDDITDTGESLRLAVDHVREAHPARVESATCLHISHSTYEPTYYAEEIPRDGWVWIVFPWNFWEDLQTLGRRALDESAGDLGKARAALKERCGLAVTEAELRHALAPGPRPPTGAGPPG